MCECKRASYNNCMHTVICLHTVCVCVYLVCAYVNVMHIFSTDTVHLCGGQESKCVHLVFAIKIPVSFCLRMSGNPNAITACYCNHVMLMLSTLAVYTINGIQFLN